MVSRQAKRSGTTAASRGRRHHGVSNDNSNDGGDDDDDVVATFPATAKSGGRIRKYEGGASDDSRQYPTTATTMPSPDKTAASTDVDDDDLDDDASPPEDDDDDDEAVPPPQTRGGGGGLVGGCDAFPGIGSLRHLRISGGGWGRVDGGGAGGGGGGGGGGGDNNANNNNNNNDDDDNNNDIAPRQRAQQQQPSTTTGISVDKILCRAPSHESNISDLSASLSPSPFGMDINNVNKGASRLASGGGADGDNGGVARSSRNGGGGGGGGDGGGVLMSVLNDCGVFANLEEVLGVKGRGGGGTSDSDDDAAPPPPPPPPPTPPPSSSPPPPPPLIAEKKTAKEDKDKKKKGGGKGLFCADYQRPAIWGVPPDGEDTDDDIADDGEGKGATTTKTDREDGEEEEEEYDNVELILDESRAAPPSASGGDVGGGDCARQAAVRGLLKNAIMPRLSALGRKDAGSPDDADEENEEDVNDGFPVRVRERRRDATPGATTRSDAVREVAPAFRSFSSGAAAKGVGGGKNNEVVRPDPPEYPERGGIDATVVEEEVEVDDLMLVLPSANEGDGNCKKKKSKMGLLKGLSFKSKPPPSKDSPTLTDDAVPLSAATDCAMNSKGINSGGKKRSKSLGRMKAPGEDGKMLSVTTDGNAVAVAADEDKGKRRSKSLGRPKKSIGEAPENHDAAKSIGVAAAAAGGSSVDANGATAPEKKKKKSKPSVPTAQEIEDAKSWRAAYDRSCEKYYYYHKGTKETRWDMPLGYHEANGGGTKDIAGSKKKIGLMGLGRKAASAKKSNDSSLGPNAGGNHDQAKYWRATLDGTTNKVYYFNKKTKEVSWTKPACLDEGKDDEGGNGNEKAEAGVEIEGPLVTAMGSVADKRKKSWFKLGGNAERNAKAEGKKAEETPAEYDMIVTDTILDDTFLPVKKAEPAFAKWEDANVAAPGEINDNAKHWRAASDASTGKTYYFNKKTKAVTWVKPAGFKEKEQTNSDSEKKAAIAAVEGETTSAKAVVGSAAEVQDPSGGAYDGTQKTDSKHPFTVDDVSAIEDFTDAEAIGNHVKVKEDTPFDETEAPFDEPFSRSMKTSQEPKSKAVVTLLPHQFEEQEDEDPQEQQDFFDQHERIPPAQFLSRRLKSNKSSDQISRQRTYASQTTASTRKAANTRDHRRSSSGNNLGHDRDDSATFDASLNNSSIASDIFDDNYKRQSSTIPASESILRNSEKDEIPHPPKTPPRVLPQALLMAKTNGGSNRSYLSKRAENLGDSSVDDSIENDRSNDQNWSGDYDDATDDVSALSGIGNESLESKKKRKNKKREDKQVHSSSRELPRSNNGNTWTQQELDLFISKNDWGSVAEYINEMRVNKSSGGKKQKSVRKESSMHEVQKKSSALKKKVQQDEALESESLWQSLSSASGSEGSFK